MEANKNEAISMMLSCGISDKIPDITEKENMLTIHALDININNHFAYDGKINFQKKLCLKSLYQYHRAIYAGRVLF